MPSDFWMAFFVGHSLRVARTLSPKGNTRIIIMRAAPFRDGVSVDERQKKPQQYANTIHL